MKTSIQFLKADEILSLRAQVLRPGQDFAKAKMPQDQDPRTFHLGLMNDGHLATIASFHVDSHKDLPAQNPYRLRGMASDPRFQGKGGGRQILDFGMRELRQRNCDLLWCNARESAFSFYEKCGFSFSGDMFDIAEIGPHKVMYKYLSES